MDTKGFILFYIAYTTIVLVFASIAYNALRDIERLGGTVTSGPYDGMHITCFRTIHWYREAQI